MTDDQRSYDRARNGAGTARQGSAADDSRRIMALNSSPTASAGLPGIETGHEQRARDGYEDRMDDIGQYNGSVRFDACGFADSGLPPMAYR